MAQIMKLDAVARLPEEVQRDADNIVNKDESLENRVESSCPAYKESEGEVEFHRESNIVKAAWAMKFLKRPSPFHLLSSVKMLNYKIDVSKFSPRPDLPQYIDISDKNTDMMNDGGRGDPLVDQDVGKVLDYVHGGHVDHDLGIRGVPHGVQHADIPLVNGHQPNKTEKLYKNIKRKNVVYTSLEREGGIPSN